MAPHPHGPDDAAACCGCDGDCDRVLTSRRIPASASEVARSLVLLDSPAAVTDNDTARITQIAPYATPSSPGGPLRIQRGCVSVRIDTDALVGAFLVGPLPEAERDDTLPALQLRGRRSERPVHRCHVLHDADRLVLEGLARVEGTLIDAPDTRFPPAPSRGDDEQPDQLERIDELITHTTRGDALLPHRHIDRGVLFALLEHTCTVVLPVGIAVLSSGALHVVQDVIHTVSWSGDLMVVSTRDAVIEVSLAAVRSCVLVRLHGAHGPTSVLELYDADNSCVALISQFGIVGDRVHDAWEQIAASLPEEA